jgi:hypothetical protein
MIKPEIKAIYEIELCCGERLFWEYLGPDSHAGIWWRDVETGRVFNEVSLMYSWTIVLEHKAISTNEVKES